MNDRTAASDEGSANLRFARGLVGELHAGGVEQAVLCPGSRSTPLAVAIAEHSGLRHCVHIDERSAAFYALGHAKATGRPVVLLCTSGTAGANFLPAVAEAHHARVPLIVLTADRPPELRSWGAAQTMEQRSLYAGFTRWFEDAPCPSERPAEAAYAVALARRAVSEATGPAPGPVHLNLPFREPLVPAVYPPLAPRAPPIDGPFRRELPVALDDDGVLARELRGMPCGVLLFGPDRCEPALAAAASKLAQSLGWPVLADPASGLRTQPSSVEEVIHGADLFMRDASVAAALRPDVVVRFGGLPTSASINAWLARHAAAALWLVDPAAGFRDPQHRATRLYRATARQFCELAAGLPGEASPEAFGWRAHWQHADRIARAAAAVAMDAEPRFLGPHVARALWSALPDGATLYVANSMPIREIDAFAGPRASSLHVLGQRGVNGIDGLVSSAVGVAAATRGPTVLWCGDLALLHDVSGLLTGRLQDANLTVVVSNDDGGGIFEYLPAAKSVPRALFEPVFCVPHGVDIGDVARGMGWQALRVASAADFTTALARCVQGGRHVIEVPLERTANTAAHAALYDAVRLALQREPVR
jgi:2-succinyl-5-enolpyruvyl-6-hydroxy-3-cyclohexene-1-carboxylate synthase